MPTFAPWKNYRGSNLGRDKVNSGVAQLQAQAPCRGGRVLSFCGLCCVDLAPFDSVSVSINFFLLAMLQELYVMATAESANLPKQALPYLCCMALLVMNAMLNR